MCMSLDKIHIIMTNDPGYTRVLLYIFQQTEKPIPVAVVLVVRCGAVAVVVEWCGVMVVWWVVGGRRVIGGCGWRSGVV